MKKQIKALSCRMLAIMVSLVLIVGAFPAAVYLAGAGENSALIVNGDFENGATGFENIDAVTYEVVPEPKNTSNHVLHAAGGGKFGQTVNVEKNTDYIWTMRMKRDDDEGAIYADVYAEDGTTNLVTSVSHSGSTGYSNMYKGRAAIDGDKGVWVTFIFKFNSGDNEKVLITADTWYKNRAFYTDDWVLEKAPEPGVIKNGDMEDGTKGYSKSDVAIFENIVDPDDSSNHVLHVGGGGNYYQAVAVVPNTDYVWTFRMKDIGSDKTTRIHVYPENSTTVNLISSISKDSTDAYCSMEYSSVATYNKKWATFTVKFNSGSNSIVRLWHNTWTEDREMYMDDWTLTEVPKVGTVVNGDFEKGEKGYTNSGVSTFEVIEEPENTANHVLHLIGGGSYYQLVSVAKNTDYIWTFKMKDLGNVGSTRILVYPENDSSNLITDIQQSGGGYAKLNDGYASVATYNKAWVAFTVKFNSGDNDKVKLFHNTWSSNRDIYMDDWALALEVKGDLVNGNFESNTTGFTSDGVLDSFKVIAEPGNPSNHVLEVGGTRAGSYWQEIKVEPNTDYIWKFRARRVSGTSGAEVVAVTPSGGGATLVKSITKTGNAYANMWNGNAFFEPYGTTWSTFEVTFNSGENEIIRLSHNAGVGAESRKDYMDDWSLIKPRAPGELLNGDFEDGSNHFDNENAVTFEVVTDPTNGNNHLLHAGGGGKFSQSIVVKPDTYYIWSFDMKNNDTFDNIYADVVASGGDYLTQSVAHLGGTYAQMYKGRAAINAKDGWATFSIRFYSGTNTNVKLQIDTWTTNRDRFFDNWKIKEAAPAGQFLNGNFEKGELNAYETDRYVTAEITEEEVYEGKYATLITKSDDPGSGNFYQSIGVEKNTDYIWRFKLKFKNTNTPVGASVKQTGGFTIQSRIDGECDTTVEPSFDFQRIRYEDTEWHEYEVFFSSGDSVGVDLIIVAYAANAKLVTDDWTLEKVGATPATDTLIDVDFEHENMGCHEITKPCWKVTDEQAHGGKYSIKYDGSASDGPTDLLYLDKHGVIADTVAVEKNTKYRFSFWYKGKGDRLDMANLTFKLYSGGSTYNHTGIYTNTDTEWKYAEHIFDSGDKTGYRLLMIGMILGSRKFTVYVDDIKLEKLGEGVIDTAIDPESVTCPDEQNVIPAGSETEMGEDFTNIQKLTLTPYGVYNFKAVYNALAANGKIGIAVDANGTPLVNGSSIFDISDTNGENDSRAFTFTAPADGVVYLVTTNEAGTVNISDLTLYSVNPVPVTPVDKVVLNNPVKNDKVSIWDQDFDFDFDWNTEQGDYEEDTDDTVITEPEEEENEKVSGKRYQRIKKRKLISKGEPGISVMTIVLICVGAAVLIGGALTVVIVLIRHKKRA